MSQYRFVLGPLVALTVACSVSACRSTPAPPPGPTVTDNTWAVVDGREITRDHVEKAYQRSGGAAQGMSAEEALAAKLTLLNDLIVQDILLAKATQLKIEVPASDLDKAYEDARKNIPEDAFQQELTRR